MTEDRKRGIDLKDGLHPVFPTPLFLKRYHDDGMNGRLLDHIMAREAKEATVGMSNVGGWHSPADLLQGDDPDLQLLTKRIWRALGLVLAKTGYNHSAATQPMSLSAWANVARGGAYNSVHNHTPALFSGVYYVSVGDPAPENRRDGLIEFVDPRPGPHGGPLPTHAFHRPLVLDPVPGMMLVFPAWLLHFVHPYNGTAPRVSIAFNLWVGKTPPAPPAPD